MIHGGGWAGHSVFGQNLLMRAPADLLQARGWRVVSIDYEEGTAGLQDVLDAVSAEEERHSSDGPVCLYGESAGAHLALVAASRLGAIDCVIGLGAPTDLMLYEAEGVTSPERRVGMVADRVARFFGTTAADTAPWDPVALAPSIHADVLLMHEGDDTIVSAMHGERFKAASPTTQNVELEAGDPADASTHFVHGTLSAAGRATYASAIASLTERAVVARADERRAARTGCPRVRRFIAEVGVPGLQNALRCLARRDAESLAAGARGWRRTTMNKRGRVNAARIWASLRHSESGRRALFAVAERHAKLGVQTLRFTVRANANP
ncbi:MAG: hypothetical protein QOG94_2424 [Solirubrobacteraceae bacterium]|nr:hypothetical protein [Solirubrobacteraceae bacterium]MEA2137293.1 hypothetical protein [Solirubrobacteraceae bacterium]